jgi:hypothetical protein
MRRFPFSSLVPSLGNILGRFRIALRQTTIPLSKLAGAALLAAGLIGADAATFISFRDGVNGYAGTQDTFITSGNVAVDNSAAATVEIDQEGEGGEFALIRFDNIFGSGANQIPPKSKILFASLTLTIVNTGNDPRVHRMLVPWQETNTWESMIDGVLADDVEAAATEDVTFRANANLAVVPLAVSTLQAWSDGAKPNHGWILLPSGTDGADFSSSEHGNLGNRPMLTVVWSTVAEPYVTSLSPLPDATDIPVDSKITIGIADGPSPLNPTSVQLLVNGVRVTPTLDKPADTNVTTITYTPTANLPQNSKVALRLIYADTATPPHVTTNNFTFTTRATTAPLVLVDDKYIWKYDRTGTDLGTAWRVKGFNDTSWEEGPALLADEGGATAEPVRTMISRFSDAGDYLQTIYFRHKFNYTGPVGGDLFLRHVLDDGAVFYLNGNEIHRFGLAAGAAYDFTTSFGGHENSWEGPFTIAGTNLVAGENILAVEVHQSGTGSSDLVFGAELLVSTVPTTPIPTPTNQTSLTLVAIDANHKWRFENTGKDLGTAWKDKAFNDAAWPEGSAAFGLETGAVAEPIRTPLVRQSPAATGIVTDYFRTHFTFTGDPATAKVSVRHIVDDGLVAYLNGVEVYRFGVAANQTFTTTATDHENKSEGPFDIPSAALVSGDNVLAVEVHQGSATSSDVVFALELKAAVTGAPPVTTPKFTVFNRTGAALSLEWTGTATLQSADAITGPWTDVANAKSPLSATISGRKFYRLR